MYNIRKLLATILLALFVCTIIPAPLAAQDMQGPGMEDIQDDSVLTARGKVLEILREETESFEMYGDPTTMTTQLLRVEVTGGEFKGEIITVENILDDRIAYNINVDEGDSVLLYIQKDAEGGIGQAYIEEIARDKYLLYLVIVFLIALILIGGTKGLKAALTLAITIFAVIKILIPLVLGGYNPIFAAVLVSSGVAAITLLIIGGISKKSFSAIAGTIGGVLIAGILAITFGSMAKLTGLGSQEAQMLMFIPQEIEFDFRGLLFAGILIGALGAVMDVAMSVSSAMNEVEVARPDMEAADLIKSGINVGRDIMGTMSNTLILAYTGSSLHLMLLFMAYDVTLIEIISKDIIATEVLRALAGTVGLIFTVPITAFLAGTIGRKAIKKERSVIDE